MAEALEWVLTGQIERRNTGDPKELAEFITNRFKPDSEKTWVECVLHHDGETVTLRRCLVKDYDSKKNSRCETRLLIDDSEVANGSELLVALFQGVPPLLMQHSLRKFVLQNPTDRRKYFERLAQSGRHNVANPKGSGGRRWTCALPKGAGRENAWQMEYVDEFAA